jgi:phage tail sheath protein FI
MKRIPDTEGQKRVIRALSDKDQTLNDLSLFHNKETTKSIVKTLKKTRRIHVSGWLQSGSGLQAIYRIGEGTDAPRSQAVRASAPIEVIDYQTQIIDPLLLVFGAPVYESHFNAR